MNNLHVLHNQSMYRHSYFIIVTATMTDPSPILTERQCIEVSINSFCNENEGSFQAQLLYTEGMCGKNATIATSTNNSDPLDKNYTFCVPINETGTICYSALVYHNSVVVGRTEPQQLILLPCNTSSLNLNHAKVVINSTMGIVYQGDEVSHNTILFFRCVMGCDLSGPGQAHCVNGTFESGSNITSSVQCTCRGGKYTVFKEYVAKLLLCSLGGFKPQWLNVSISLHLKHVIEQTCREAIVPQYTGVCSRL